MRVLNDGCLLQCEEVERDVAHPRERQSRYRAANDRALPRTRLHWVAAEREAIR